MSFLYASSGQKKGKERGKRGKETQNCLIFQKKFQKCVRVWKILVKYPKNVQLLCKDLLGVHYVQSSTLIDGTRG